MIQNDQERKIVERQLRELEKRLEKVRKRQPYPNQKYSRASLKKMMAHIKRKCKTRSEIVGAGSPRPP